MHTTPFPRGRTVGRRGGGPDKETDMTADGEEMLMMATIIVGVFTCLALTLAFG